MIHSYCSACEFFFFFKQKTAYEMRISDWSSDVCSSDLSPTARSRALVTGATRPGTVAGEFIRNVALFKSFMVSRTYLHMRRMMAQRGLAGKAKYLAWITIGMTAAGALAAQASAVYRGKAPRPMDDPKFWLSGVARGGRSEPTTSGPPSRM